MKIRTAGMWVALAVVAWLIVVGGSVRADDYTGIADGDWSNPDNWRNDTTGNDPALSPPGSGDSVNTAFNNYTVRSGNNSAAAGALVQRGGPLTVETNATLSVGDHQLSSFASVDIFGTFTVGDQNKVRDRVGGNEIEVFAGGTYDASGSTLAMLHGDFGVIGSGSTVEMEAMTWSGDRSSPGTMNFEADAGGFSTVDISGGLSFSGDDGDRELNVDVSPLDPASGQTWTLMEFGSISRDAAGDWANKNILGGEPADWDLAVNDPANNGPGTVTLTALGSAVPEPASLALLSLGGLVLVRGRRRGRRAT